MEPVVIISALALIQYIYFALEVGNARGKYGIKAPETAGHEIFERIYRVQTNTLEQLVIFLPSLWGFGFYIDPLWAALLGAIYLIGRVIYGISYVKSPDTRGPGMIVTTLPIWILLLGTLGAAIWQLIPA